MVQHRQSICNLQFIKNVWGFDACSRSADRPRQLIDSKHLLVWLVVIAHRYVFFKKNLDGLSHLETVKLCHLRRLWISNHVFTSITSYSDLAVCGLWLGVLDSLLATACGQLFVKQFHFVVYLAASLQCLIAIKLRCIKRLFFHQVSRKRCRHKVFDVFFCFLRSLFNYAGEARGAFNMDYLLLLRNRIKHTHLVDRWLFSWHQRSKLRTQHWCKAFLFVYCCHYVVGFDSRSLLYIFDNFPHFYLLPKFHVLDK